MTHHVLVHAFCGVETLAVLHCVPILGGGRPLLGFLIGVLSSTPALLARNLERLLGLAGAVCTHSCRVLEEGNW